MKTLFPLVLIGVLVLTGCSSTPGDAGHPRAAGYTISGDTVVFQFKAWEFSFITNGKTGVWLPLEKLPRIDAVTVAGSFNSWNTAASRMNQDGEGGYSLEVPLAELKAYGPTIPFKFVLNGLWWVEPTVRTSNSADTKLTNKSSNLVLTLP